MFAWFQTLLPRKGDFFGMFEAHAATLVKAAEALKQLTTDGASTGEILKIIRDREHDADEIIRQVLTEVRRTFLTPFDRGSITSLIVAMDDTIDEMLATARAIDLYGLQELRPEMKQVVNLICDAAALTSEAVPLLRKVTSNGARLHQLTGKVVSSRRPGRRGPCCGIEACLRECAAGSASVRRRPRSVQESRTGDGCVRGRGE